MYACDSIVIGEPNTESDLTIDNIVLSLKSYLSNIELAVKYIDKQLEQNHKKIYDKVVLARHYYKVYKTEVGEIKLEEKTVIAFYNKALELVGRMKSSEVYKEALEEAFNKYLLPLHIDRGKFINDFEIYYGMKSGYTNLEDDIETIRSNIQDLKTTTKELPVLYNLLEANGYPDSRSFKVGEELNRESFKHLGEFLIHDIELLDITNITFWFLYSMA